MNDQLPARPRLALPLVAVCCLLPTAQTLLSVYLEIWPFVLYPAMKMLILAAPILIWRLQRLPRRELLSGLGVRRTTLLPGLISGAFLGGVILLAYFTFLGPMVDAAPLAAKAKSLGILKHYWLMAVFISFWNSLIEEYYWRAFLYDQLQRYGLRPLALIALGGAMFGLHHVFIFLDLVPLPQAALFTFGTAFAGGLWAWQRTRGHSIFDCYVSHIIADLAGLWAGWDLIQRVGG